MPPAIALEKVAGSPLKTWTGVEDFRRSYRWTLWSAEPTAISCAVLGLYFTQQTLARSSIEVVGAACLVDQACASLHGSGVWCTPITIDTHGLSEFNSLEALASDIPLTTCLNLECDTMQANCSQEELSCLQQAAISTQEDAGQEGTLTLIQQS